MNFKKTLFSLVLAVSMVQAIQADADIFNAIANNDIDGVKDALNEDRHNLIKTQIDRDRLEIVLPIHQAAKSALNTRILDTLFYRGADLNQKSETGKTPLFYAIANNRDQYIIDFLLKHGARTDVVDDYGNTLLHAALLAENHSTNKSKNIERLLMLGVDPMLSNNQGINPFKESILIRELNAAIDARAEENNKKAAEITQEEFENEECMICLEAIKDLPSSVNKTTCCKHFICESCLADMKSRNLTTCPACRQDNFEIRKINTK